MFRALLVISAFIFGALIHSQEGEAVAAFPLLDCRTQTIDLLLVAHGVESGFKEQMKLFSLLIDLFLSPDETELHRLKVAGLLYRITPGNGFQSTQVFDFSKYVSRSDVQGFLGHILYSDGQFNSDTNTSRLTQFSSSSVFDTRENAQQVAVVVTEQSDLNSLWKGDLKYINNVFKIFLVIVDHSVYKNPTAMKWDNSVRVRNYASLKHAHVIAVGLCGTCFLGWLGFQQRHSNSLLWTHSCYVLEVSKKRVAWTDALKSCEMIQSSLVSIESDEELQFLKPLLRNRSDSLMRENNITVGSGIFPIQIGLTRDRESLSKRFRWVNNSPLTVTHWGDYPDGGFVQSCGAWIFNSFQILENWEDFGCGYTNSHLYLCEVNIKTVNPGYISYSTVKNSSGDHVRAALLRGELARCPGSDTFVSSSEMISKRGNQNCALFSHGERGFLHHWSQFIALFNCEDQQATFIAYSFVCDHKIHCPNGRDEAVCMYRQCDPLYEFTCISKQCVPAEARCDLYMDCYDRSDEIDCIECKYMRCQDGTCLPTHWWFDDETDCIWGVGFSKAYIWDIDSPLEMKTGECAFLCNRTQCVTEAMLGDGVIDCTGPEGPLDETVGALEKSKCRANEDLGSTAWSPKCVYYRDRYDSPLGCRNMKHLQGCRDFTCPGGYLKCPGSYCIPMHQAHDGRNDCPLGEDEMNEFFPECPGNFVCMKSRVCVYIDLVCDGFPHCPEGDDELNCQMSCGQGFLCVGGAVTVYDYDRSTPLLSLNFIDPRVRYLDLSGVILSEAFPNILHMLSLSNLHILRLSDCGIQSVDIEYDRGKDLLQLSSIHTMDLSHNSIKSIHESSILRIMYNLRDLNLSYNKLKAIDVKAFELNGFQSSLRFLDLSYTEISSTYKLFDPLVNLTFLNLSHTLLSDLRYGTFSSKGKLKLQVLDLRSITLSDFYPDTFKGVTVTSSLYTDTYLLCCPQVRGRGINSKVCHAPADPLSTCSDLMGDELKRVLLWLAGSMAVLGNLVVIVYRIRWTRPLLKKAYGMFVVHLAVSDVIMGVYLLIIASADVYYRNVYIWHEKRWRSHTVCQIAGFASMLSCEVSTCFVFLITLDRFLVIKYPLSNVRLSRRVTIAICFLVWLVGSVVALVPLFPKFKHWSTYSSNGMCLGLPLTSQRLPGWQFSSAIYIGFNCLLFLLIVIGQITIYRIIAAASRKQRDLCAVNSSRQQQDFVAARQLFLVAMTNFLCWFPIGVMGLVSLSGYEIGLTAYAWSAVLIMPVNSALNPVLYTIPALLDKFHQLRRRDTSTARKTGSLNVCSKCQSSYKLDPAGENKTKI